MAYEVRTAVFEGPLDLLLQLITRHQVDVTEISLGGLVKEYLSFVDAMREMDLDVTSEFLLIASTLIQLKARQLLPSGAEVDLDEELALMEERDRLLGEGGVARRGGVVAQRALLQQLLRPVVPLLADLFGTGLGLLEGGVLLHLSDLVLLHLREDHAVLHPQGDRRRPEHRLGHHVRSGDHRPGHHYLRGDYVEGWWYQRCPGRQPANRMQGATAQQV